MKNKINKLVLVISMLIILMISLTTLVLAETHIDENYMNIDNLYASIQSFITFNDDVVVNGTLNITEDLYGSRSHFTHETLDERLMFNNHIIIGDATTSTTPVIAIGKGANTGSGSGKSTIAIGTNAVSSEGSITIGEETTGSDGSITIGNSLSGSESSVVAIGLNTINLGTGSYALGSSITTGWWSEGFGEGLNLAYRSTALGREIEASNKTISVGQNLDTDLDFKGYWNPVTNTPTLADGVGTLGDRYIISPAGAYRDLGSGNIYWGVNNWIVYTSSNTWNLFVWDGTTNMESINIGFDNDVIKEYSISLGREITNNGRYGVAIGTGAIVNSANDPQKGAGIAIGGWDNSLASRAIADGSSSIALGQAKAEGKYGVAIGYGAGNTEDYTFNIGGNHRDLTGRNYGLKYFDVDMFDSTFHGNVNIVDTTDIDPSGDPPDGYGNLFVDNIVVIGDSKLLDPYYWLEGGYSEVYGSDGNAVTDFWNYNSGDAAFGLRYSDNMFMVGTDYTLSDNDGLNMNMDKEWGLGQLPVAGTRLTINGDINIIGNVTISTGWTGNCVNVSVTDGIITGCND